ncbi:hypothetical protein GCM10012280_49420 [Wenjunlia tyrosinilytica]|uniref:Uncharacterized protein n=1 Tax=Wenjunlia tyrosinilytica TaxID=1544741 RepID=A0A917ZVQ4_9ACTN|nr:hypothetical protein GCM10012280_49420 [Wenjunlia tyrosinilytica]
MPAALRDRSALMRSLLIPRAQAHQRFGPVRVPGGPFRRPRTARSTGCAPSAWFGVTSLSLR